MNYSIYPRRPYFGCAGDSGVEMSKREIVLSYTLYDPKDMRLFEAAPDLLHAAHQSLNMVRALRKDLDNATIQFSQRDVAYSLFKSVEEKLNAAIRKAEGDE